MPTGSLTARKHFPAARNLLSGPAPLLGLTSGPTSRFQEPQVREGSAAGAGIQRGTRAGSRGQDGWTGVPTRGPLHTGPFRKGTPVPAGFSPAAPLHAARPGLIRRGTRGPPAPTALAPRAPAFVCFPFLCPQCHLSVAPLSNRPVSLDGAPALLDPNPPHSLMLHLKRSPAYRGPR